MAQWAGGTKESGAELLDGIQALPLPVLLIDLRDGTVAAVSRAAASVLGLEPAEALGKWAPEFLVEHEREKGRATLEAMRNGQIDFYRSHRTFVAADGEQVPATVWVRAVHEGDDRFAILQLARGVGTDRSPLSDYLGAEPTSMALGMVDASWTITWVSSDITDLLGLKPNDLVGRVLLGNVQQDDVSRLLLAATKTGETCLVALAVHFRDADNGWRRLCCLLSSDRVASERFFILLPLDEPDDGLAGRVTRLESHLQRIAAEVEASGILLRVGPAPDPERLPQLRALSLRQWDVLSRLAAGERVPEIAEALHVSQSTVRNHLSAIFDRFGVHSQAQLLALIHQAASSPS